MNTPPTVSAQEWEAARQQLLAKEKELTRARDALAAQRRRMPQLAVEKTYEFDGPDGKASLLDLFDGRRQLIIYRAFYEPGVGRYPDYACIGCSMVADQVAHDRRDGRGSAGGLSPGDNELPMGRQLLTITLVSGLMLASGFLGLHLAKQATNRWPDPRQPPLLIRR